MDGNIIQMISESFQQINRVGSLIGFLMGFVLSGLVFLWFRDVLKKYRKTIFLQDIRQPHHTKVLLMDLSWEGGRIRAPKLDKKVVYYLTIPQNNGNICLECVVERKLLRQENEYVYSISFLYLFYEVRQQLMRLLKDKALEIKLATTHPISSLTKPTE